MPHSSDLGRNKSSLITNTGLAATEWLELMHNVLSMFSRVPLFRNQTTLAHDTNNVGFLDPPKNYRNAHKTSMQVL